MDSACGKISEDGLTISDKVWPLNFFHTLSEIVKPSGNIPDQNRELSEPPATQIEGINFDLDC
jgi:hypothetical protein